MISSTGGAGKGGVKRSICRVLVKRNRVETNSPGKGGAPASRLGD